MRNRWHVVKEWVKGSTRSERKRTVELLTIKWALEQADIWNDMETSRVTGQSGERWSEGVRWFIDPEIPIARCSNGPDFYFVVSGVFIGLKISWIFPGFSQNSGLGGLGVACWPLVPKFAGSNPAEAVGFFGAKKSSARLPSEGK